MNTQNNATQRDPPELPGLDFAVLSVAELVATLSAIGQILLCNLLHGGYLPDWSLLLPLEQAQILGGTSQKRGYGIARQKKPSSPEEPTKQAIAGQLSLPEWRSRIQNWLRCLFGCPLSTRLPDDLLPILGEAAWRDLDFQYWVAAQVRIYLRPRVLIEPGEMPFAQLSPKTMWALIALSGSRISHPRRSLNPKRRATLIAAKRLRIAGGEQALATGGWAGFWDQWVISEALRHWPDALKPLDVQLHNALTSMPLLATTSPEMTAQRNGKKGKTKSILLAASNWKEGIPPWFFDLHKTTEPNSNGDE